MNFKVIKIICIIILLGSSISARCQKERYHDIGDSSKTVIYYETFDKNELQWSDGSDGKSFGEIKNGIYTWKSLYQGARITFNSFVFPQDSSFEIEALIRFNEGDSTSLCGLVWGYASAKKCFVFGFNNMGSLKSYKTEDTITIYHPWQKSVFYRKNNWNKLTIRRIEDYTTCYLNEQLIARIPFEPFFDKKIGFMVAPRSSISIDWMKISLLKIKRNYD